jgi:hypothetical protein
MSWPDSTITAPVSVYHRVSYAERYSRFRARDALQFIEWYTELAVRQCTLAVQVLPEEMLADREALTACLAEELRDLGRRQAEAIASHWQAEWEERMAGKFVDLPNIQN